MAKLKNKIIKNIEKNKEQKQEENPIKNNILTATKIIFTIIILGILVTIITVVANGNYKFGDKEIAISYDEIMAGQTFNRSEEEYYVVFYEFESNEDLSNAITNATTTKKIYKVNLKNSMNKNIISTDSNKTATNAGDLKISGPTLIKIENNQNVDYIEGYEQIKEYLKEI